MTADSNRPVSGDLNPVHDPWDAEAGEFMVLVNAANQHSLWPAHLPVPAGWTVVLTARPMQACLEWIEGQESAAPAALTATR